MELRVIIKEDNTVIIASKEKWGVMAVYNCKTTEQVGNAVKEYIEGLK